MTSRYSVKFFAPCKAKGFSGPIPSFSSDDKSCYLNDGSGPPCAGTRSFGHGRPTHTSNPAKLNKGPNKETSQLTLFYYYIYMYEQICLFFLRYFYNFRAKIQAVPVFFFNGNRFLIIIIISPVIQLTVLIFIFNLNS